MRQLLRWLAPAAALSLGAFAYTYTKEPVPWGAVVITVVIGVIIGSGKWLVLSDWPAIVFLALCAGLLSALADLRAAEDMPIVEAGDVQLFELCGAVIWLVVWLRSVSER